MKRSLRKKRSGGKKRRNGKVAIMFHSRDR